MKNKTIFFLLFTILLFNISLNAQEIRRINYNNVSADIVIDKPSNYFVDVLIAYHGTVLSDENIIPAAQNMLTRVKAVTDRNNMMIISVAYPQEGRLLGDSIIEAEAAFLWVKHYGKKALKRKINKIYLVGHSFGGYVVTRLNTMHATDGVIANAPGPLNLVYRCGLEETGQIQQGAVCGLLRQTYGTTIANPTAYMERSLLNFTENHRSDMLFVQGLQDSPIQIASWPTFKKQVTNCNNCLNRQFVEISNGGHGSLFESPEAKSAYNNFINR
jgi:hypothetical protein